MKTVNVSVARDGAEPRSLGRAEVAASIWSRFWGLMGRRGLPEGQSLLIDPCTSVHMFFMRFPLDIVYLDAENRVVKVVASLKQWRVDMGAKGAKKVLEMSAGAADAAGIRVGDALAFSDVA